MMISRYCQGTTPTGDPCTNSFTQILTILPNYKTRLCDICVTERTSNLPSNSYKVEIAPPLPKQTPRKPAKYEPKHGLADTYTTYGCRCPSCTQAFTEAAQAFRQFIEAKNKLEK